MNSFKTHGLIYKINDYKDYDQIISILSPDHGKITATVRGAKRPKSSKKNHIDLFNFNSFVITKTGKYESISETKTFENFRLFRDKYPFYLFYLCEIIDKISVSEEDCEQIYKLIYITLKLADLDDFKKFIAIIELRLLKIMGLEPQLFDFIDTGNRMSTDDSYYYSFTIPGYETFGEKNCKMSSELIKCQRFMLFENIEAQKKLSIKSEILDNILKINKIWIENTLEIKLKTIKFLNL